MAELVKLPPFRPHAAEIAEDGEPEASLARVEGVCLIEEPQVSG
jgi:hypothetical protein